MASTFKALYRGFAPTSASSVYTVPGATKTLITNIVVANQDATARTFTINLYNGTTDVPLASGTTVPAKDSVIIDAKTLLETGNIIRVLASASAQVAMHISGLELT